MKQSRVTGYRTILNTQHSITKQIERVGPRCWRVTWGICNGIAGGSQDYRTRWEALAEYNK